MLKQEIKSAWSDLIALGKDHKAIINEFMSALSWMKQGIRDFGYGFQLLSTLIWYLILLTVFIVFICAEKQPRRVKQRLNVLCETCRQ